MSSTAQTLLTPPRKVLYTGSSGRVGSRVVSKLSETFDVYSTDIRNTEPPTPQFEVADLTDFAQVQRLCKGMDAIVHSAIPSSRAFGVENEEQTPQEDKFAFDNALIEVNGRAVYNLFEAARREGIKRIVFISSLTTVLANKTQTVLPDAPPAPTNVYACTKLFGEYLAEVFSRNFEMSILCLRLGQPYPFGSEKEPMWLANPRSRSIFTAFDDIAGAIEAALLYPVNEFGLFPVASYTTLNPPRVDISAGEKYGYKPKFFCDEQGVWHRREDLGL